MSKAEEQIEGKDQYVLDTTLAAGDTLKVTSSEGDWFPTGMGNDYRVTANGEYRLHFTPEGGVTDWYSGYFFLELLEEGEEGIVLTVDITITNLDETMQKPQFVYSVDEGANYNYVNDLVVDEENPGHFTREIPFAGEATVLCSVATWGAEDPWPEYRLYYEGAEFEFQLTVTATLTISGNLGLASEGGASGNYLVD